MHRKIIDKKSWSLNALSFLSSNLCLLLISFSLYGQSEDQVVSQQSPKDFKLGVKVNTNYVLDLTKKNYSFGELAPAVVIATKRNTFHEVELNRILLTKKQAAYYQDKNVDIGLRYQHTLTFTKQKSKLIPQIGLSALVQIANHKIVPVDVGSFTRSTSYFGGSIGVIPQIRYFAGKRFFFDLSAPLNFVDLGYRGQRINNPAIPVRQQRNGEFELDFYFLNQLELKFGTGVRF